LNVAAIESGQTQFKLVAVDVLATLQALITYYQQQFKAKNLDLQLIYTDKHYLAYADTHALQQVLDNLISNAIKYSPPNKTITLRLQQDHQAVRCHVHDQGPGISEAEQPKLFGKFTRLTTRPTAGEHSTGLGLFIVKKLVEAMQGQVWYQNQAHQGSIFTIQLLSYQR
ncbi:MAG: sensor histidine kinase, partial [Pseudomonadota bacterium]|nr:sensor histidine kinase [Pseudomonadota bacterium]